MEQHPEGRITRGNINAVSHSALLHHWFHLGSHWKNRSRKQVWGLSGEPRLVCAGQFKAHWAIGSGPAVISWLGDVTHVTHSVWAAMLFYIYWLSVVSFLLFGINICVQQPVRTLKLLITVNDKDYLPSKQWSAVPFPLHGTCSSCPKSPFQFPTCTWDSFNTLVEDSSEPNPH